MSHQGRIQAFFSFKPNWIVQQRSNFFNGQRGNRWPSFIHASQQSNALYNTDVCTYSWFLFLFRQIEKPFKINKDCLEW